MGNKSKMVGATSKNYGKSQRQQRNGGAFGGNRWRGFKMVVEVHKRHPRSVAFDIQVVPLKTISYGKVFNRQGRSKEGHVL